MRRVHRRVLVTLAVLSVVGPNPVRLKAAEPSPRFRDELRRTVEKRKERRRAQASQPVGTIPGYVPAAGMASLGLGAQGDLVVWDNRAVAHAGPVDPKYIRGERIVHRTTVEGDLPQGPDGFVSRSLHGELFNTLG